MSNQSSNINKSLKSNENNDSNVIPIYITCVHPVLVNDSIIWDIFYLTENSKDLHCVRVFNIMLSFMVARLPTVKLDQFVRLMKVHTKTLHTEIRTDLSDSSYFNLGRNREYMEIFSSSPTELTNCYKSIFKDLEYFYKRINVDKLSPEDKLFYNNTETPFRFTSTTLSVPNSIYNLSTKYDIPLIGGALLDKSRLVSTFPSEFLPEFIKVENIMGLNAQTTKNWNYETVNNNITLTLSKNDYVDFKCNMTMLSYDIETYNRTGDMTATEKENYIFCIGVGIFNLNSQQPEKRLCIISKDFDAMSLNPKAPDGRPLTVKKSTRYGCKTYKVQYEYNPAIETDMTEYIITKSEKQLLEIFINVLHEFKPQIINGFNSFGFDDEYVYRRMEMYHLENRYLQEFTYYNIEGLEKEWWFKSFKPQFRQFNLKIDGEDRKDNQSVRATLVLCVDVYKLMLKEDPKRFTQYGRGNLNTMLEVYDVQNPYTLEQEQNNQLSKSGLTYTEMFDKWDKSEDIYSIGLYCCQDAWICGTLLVKRSKLADLIEMAGISYTTLSDSIYRADGTRVANSILAYAYNEKFAFMDTAFEHRDKVKTDKSITPFGGKKYDKRTIVGGAVRIVHAGRQWFIVALDYSSMYPSAKEASNLDSSSRVDDDIIYHPELYGIMIVKKIQINDTYGNREIYYIKKVDENDGNNFDENNGGAKLNLEKHQFDLVTEAENSTNGLKYGIDYDYIVESFYCEYKLDVKALNSIQGQFNLSTNPVEQQALINQFHELYPEYTSDNIGIANIPETIFKKAFFVQSPKGKDGLPSVHYSLKEKMLSDFRAKRSKVKKMMFKAAEEGDKVGEIRFNAKQLAIKVVSNSEYGASGKSCFAHYDPDVAAVTTYASRQHIKFLTSSIEASTLYVDEKFLKDNAKQIELLNNIKCLSVSPLNMSKVRNGNIDGGELIDNDETNEEEIIDDETNGDETNEEENIDETNENIDDETNEEENINDNSKVHNSVIHGSSSSSSSTIDLFALRRHVLRRIFDDSYNIICPQVYAISIKPSTVCYQDTDSNYYRNDYIIEYFLKLQHNTPEYTCSPEQIDGCMHAMLAHNELIAAFARDTIQRRPYALGFEGSFIVCRYLNRKKKYYGIVWSHEGTPGDIPAARFSEPEAYNIDGTLIDDYMPYWKPKKTVIPQPNGNYIYIDFDKLLNKGVNYLDYVHDQNVKCTGVDLARRDQYKFINLFHIVSLQYDLRLMKYNGDNKWTIFKKDESMIKVVDAIIEKFRKVISVYSTIASLKSDVKPEYEFKLLDFAKSRAYKPNKPQSPVTVLVKRLIAENKQQYIPTIGERMSYVVILDEATKQERLMGKASSGNMLDHSLVVDEFLDQLKAKYPEQQIMQQINKLNLKLTYDDFINAKAICELDFKYYLKSLCESLALYILGDLYPNEVKDIDDGVYDSKEANALVTKLKGKIAKEYVDKYFYSGTSVKQGLNAAKKATNTYSKKLNKTEDTELLYNAYPKLRESESITQKDKMCIKSDAESKIEKMKTISECCERVYKYICTNSFNDFVSDNQIDNKLYHKYCNDPDHLLEIKAQCDDNIYLYIKILKYVDSIRFQNYLNEQKKSK